MPYTVTGDGTLTATGEMKACLDLMTSWFVERHGRIPREFDELSVWVAALCSLAKGEWEYWGNRAAIQRLETLLYGPPAQRSIFDAFDFAAESVTAKRLVGWKPDLLQLVEEASTA